MHKQLAIAAAICLLSLVVYLRTMAPGLTWAHQGADGGDLAAAVMTGGIPHPPGYPSYVLTARIFAALPVGDVAFRLNLMSALCAAAAAGVVYLLARALLQPSRNALDGGEKDTLATCGESLASAAAALAFAFSPVFWSQALITEVYAFNALLCAVLLLLASARCPRPWLCLVLGFGLGNHLSLVLLAPALALMSGPSVLRGRRAEWRWYALALAAGLAVYLYLPVRAAASPLINWGDPRTLERFVWTVTAAPYRGYFFDVAPAELPGRPAAWAALLVQQFGWPGLAVILLGLWESLSSGDTRRAWAVASVFVLYSIYALGYRTADSYVYLIPAYLAAALWLARGLLIVWQMLHAWTPAALRRRLMPLLAAALLIALPAYQLAANWRQMDVSRDDEARSFVAAVMAELPPRALVLTASDEHTFALWYEQAARGRDDIMVVDRDLTQFAWYRAQIAARAPDIAPPADLSVPAEYMAALVQSASQQRAVFLAGDAALQRSFRWQRRGVLWVLMP